MTDLAALLQSLQHIKWNIFSKDGWVSTNQERKVLYNHIGGLCYRRGKMRDFDSYRTHRQLNTRLRVLINLEEEYWEPHLLTERCKSQHRQQARLCLTSLAFLAVSAGRAPFRRPFFFLELLIVVEAAPSDISPIKPVCSHLRFFKVVGAAPPDIGRN